jgi:hypothetical protein
VSTSKQERRVRDFALAMKAGVVLRLNDWRKLSDDEKVAWLAARRILAASPAAPEEAPPAAAARAENPAAFYDPAESLQIRTALERTADRVRARAEER